MKKEMLFIVSLSLIILSLVVISAQTVSNTPIEIPSTPILESIKLTSPPSSSIGSTYKTAEDLCKLNDKIISIERLNSDLSLSNHECAGSNNFNLNKGEGYRFNFNSEAKTPEDAKLNFQGTQESNSEIKLYNFSAVNNKSIISEFYLPEAWNSHSADELCTSIPEANQIMQLQQQGLLLQFCHGPGNITLQTSSPVILISNNNVVWNSLAPGEKQSKFANFSPTKIFLLIIIPIILIIIVLSIYYIKRKLNDEKHEVPLSIGSR